MRDGLGEVAADVQAGAVNPYQPPNEVIPALATDPLDSVLESVQRMDFNSVIQRRDLIDAVAGTGFRIDVGTLRQLARLGAPPLLILVGISITFGPGIVSLSLQFAVAGFIAFLLYLRHRLIRNYTNVSGDIIGSARGYIDSTSMRIEQEHQTRLLRMDQLVCVTYNQRRISLCFDATFNRFETIRFDDFATPSLARDLAEQLSRVRPPVAPLPVDRRRSQPSQAEPLFSAVEPAFQYAGPVAASDLKSSDFTSQWRRLVVGATVKMTLVLGVSVGVLLSLFGMNVVTVLFCVLIAACIVPGFLAIGRAHREIHRDDQPLWYARGWVDRDGIVAITTIGQTKSNWLLFGKPEFSERSIVLKYASAPLWYILNRGQFHSEQDWNEVCRLVANRIPG